MSLISRRLHPPAQMGGIEEANSDPVVHEGIFNWNNTLECHLRCTFSPFFSFCVCLRIIGPYDDEKLAPLFFLSVERSPGNNNLRSLPFWITLKGFFIEWRIGKGLWISTFYRIQQNGRRRRRVCIDSMYWIVCCKVGHTRTFDSSSSNSPEVKLK